MTNYNKTFNSFKATTSILGILLFIILNTTSTVYAQTDWNDPGPSIVKNRNQSYNVSSLREVDGRPAIAYCEVNSNFIIRYQRATDSKGTSWGSPITVDMATFSGVYSIDMEIINGNPAVANCTGQTNDIRYTRALNSTGDFWSSTVIVASGIASSSTVTRDVKLKEVNGKPAIAYYDGDDGDLYYVQATNADGSTWGTPVLITSTDNIGEYLSMSIIDGRPAIAYYNKTSQDLEYVRANDVDGSSWGAPITVWSSGNVGVYASLTTVNGRPAITFSDITNNRVLYMRASNSTGSTWSIPSIVTSHRGEHMDLLVADGKPAIAYYTGFGDHDLRYVYSQDVDGTSWETPVVLDDGSAAMGNFLSMAIIDGNPAISYQDFTNSDLKYIRATYSDGLVLPVELTFFRGEMTAEGTKLTWQTASEEINEGFEVQRSRNGQNWEAIDFVAGNGTTLEIQDYEYIDYNTPNTKVYYRLKQMDFDGAFEYSNVVVITIKEMNQTTVRIYPTVVKNDLNIEGGQGKVTIYNTFGQPVMSVIEYNANTRIVLDNLSSGQYFLRIQNQNGESISTTSFIKVD